MIGHRATAVPEQYCLNSVRATKFTIHNSQLKTVAILRGPLECPRPLQQDFVQGYAQGFVRGFVPPAFVQQLAGGSGCRAPSKWCVHAASALAHRCCAFAVAH